MPDDPEYLEWEREVPAAIKQDPLWNLRVHRWALFLADRIALDLAGAIGDARLGA